MANGFDVNKIYAKEYSKNRVIKLIKNCYDKKFMVVFMPRSENNADIVIRSLT